MVAIDDAINDLLRQGRYDDASIKEAVESVVYAEVREQQRKEEEDRLAMKLEMEESKRKNVLAFLRNFIEGIKEGVINNGNRYSPNTCKVWTSFEHILTDFYNSNPFTWEMIDRRLADRFVYTLEKKGLCKEKDRIQAQYALESSSQPLGISEYDLEKFYPEKVEGTIPTIEEIEATLSKD